MGDMLHENESTGLSEEQSERFDVLVQQLESLGPDPKDDPSVGVDLKLRTSAKSYAGFGAVPSDKNMLSEH